MPRLAEVVRVRRREGRISIEIDGEVFPWYTSTEGCKVQTRRGDMPGVALTIVAKRVELEDEL